MKTQIRRLHKIVILGFLAIGIITGLILLVSWGTQKYEKYGTFSTMDHLKYLIMNYDNSFVVYDIFETELYSGTLEAQSEFSNNNDISLVYEDGKWFFNIFGTLLQFHKITDKPIIVTIHEGREEYETKF